MDNQYMDMFLDESHEHLQSLNEGLLQLEENMEEISVVNDIFRNAHTLKGMSATMGFSKIAELTHEMEDVLDLVRKKQLKLNEDIMDTLFKCLDSLEQMVDSVGSGEAEDVVDVSDLVVKLSSISKGTPAPAVAAPAAAAAAPSVGGDGTRESGLGPDDIDLDIMKKAKEAGMHTFRVKVTLMETCVLKAVRSVMVMHALDEVGDVIKSIPSAEDLEQEKFERSFDIIIATSNDGERIKNAVDTVSEIEDILVEELNPDQLVKEDAAPAAPAVSVSAEKKEVAKPPAAPAKKLHHSQSVRVDIEKLDTLMNLMGELVINKVRLEQIGQTHRMSDLMETLEQMDRVTGDLQNIVMKVRMVPISAVFNRFPRMVRDVSKELGKEINLTIEGEETELDRTIIDEIGDPIMHLLRNSLDHGIESPEKREAKGKPRVGEVGLIARHEGNNVVIMITDDGAGIDAGKIRKKAVEKGMISQKEAERLDDAGAVRLIFLPGFSTAERITDISGRGVGMDVVRSKIEALSGHVDVETHIDEGSVFKIKLPLTLSIIQAMLVQVQEEMYAIRLGSIDRTINIKPTDIQTVRNKEVIVLRGEIIPIIRMENALQVPHTKDADELFVVVVHAGEAKAGIVVDNLIGQQEIVIKTLGKLFAGLKLFSGATVLGDGKVALILDVATMIQQ